MTIPTELEKLILAGKADFGMSTHKAGQFLLPKPAKGNYRVLYGMRVHNVNQGGATALSVQIGSRNSSYFTQYNVGSGTNSGRDGDYHPLYIITDDVIRFQINCADFQAQDPSIGFGTTDLQGYPYNFLNPDWYISGSRYLQFYRNGSFGRYSPFGSEEYARLTGADQNVYDSWFIGQLATVFADKYMTGDFFWSNVPGFTLYFVTVKGEKPGN